MEDERMTPDIASRKPACVVCKKGMPQVTLFRINAKGVPGLWACHLHRSQTDAPHDPVLDEIVRALGGKT